MKPYFKYSQNQKKQSPAPFIEDYMREQKLQQNLQQQNSAPRNKSASQHTPGASQTCLLQERFNWQVNPHLNQAYEIKGAVRPLKANDKTLWEQIAVQQREPGTSSQQSVVGSTQRSQCPLPRQKSTLNKESYRVMQPDLQCTPKFSSIRVFAPIEHMNGDKLMQQHREKKIEARQARAMEEFQCKKKAALQQQEQGNGEQIGGSNTAQSSCQSQNGDQTGRSQHQQQRLNHNKSDIFFREEQQQRAPYQKRHYANAPGKQQNVSDIFAQEGPVAPKKQLLGEAQIERQRHMRTSSPLKEITQGAVNSVNAVQKPPINIAKPDRPAHKDNAQYWNNVRDEKTWLQQVRDREIGRSRAQTQLTDQTTAAQAGKQVLVRPKGSQIELR